jgi:DNA-binding GntR family transcriptional regulator
MSENSIIVRRSLHDELTSRLRDMITEGELKPGQKIPEAELCERFGVSRTPMREALKVLASEGLLNLLPNRGATVAKITQEEIEELFPIMGALEALAGSIACERIGEDELSAIRRDHEQMLQHYEQAEWVAYSKLNRSIHEAIFKASGNASLSALYQQFLIRIHSVRFMAKRSPARWRQAIEEHEQMMAALEARDGERLAKIMMLHLQHKAEMVQEGLKELEGERS